MRDMYWLNSPSFVVPYTAVLIAIVAVTVIRAGLLSWRLFRGLPRRRIPLDRVLDGSVSADELARAALANRVSHGSPDEHLAQQRAGPSPDIEAGLRTLRAADARFDYLWLRLTIAVSSTRTLMRLTVIAAAFITAYGFLPNWQYSAAENNSNAFPAGLPALYEAGEWVLARLALGLGVAGGLCIPTMVFDCLLQHRLASWKYVYATACGALSDGPPLA